MFTKKKSQVIKTSFIADETTNVSAKKQLPIANRYISKLIKGFRASFTKKKGNLGWMQKFF